MPKVVIVGAGIAGLAAAVELGRRGVKDFVLLEAGDRVGGRISVKDYKGRKLHMGANWIHNADKDNPLVQFLKGYSVIY